MLLKEVKDYLKIDYEEEDTYLQSLIEVSEIYIDSCVGENYKTNDKLIKLSKIAQYKLISDMYTNRSTYIEDKSKQDRIVTTILDKLSNAEEI